MTPGTNDPIAAMPTHPA